MNDDFEFSQWELEQLKRLPGKHQQFADRYPESIRNVLDRLDSPPLPKGYQPKWINFYYFDEAEEPHISFVGGELKYIDLPENIAESRLIHVQIDGSAAYIEIEREIVLNRLGGIKLPKAQITDQAIFNTLKWQLEKQSV
jgi:hypothetical protein